jgi:hypothetical protein
MNLKIPFIGFIDKTLHMNVIQRFLSIFRDTRDIDRVIIVIPLTLLISHSFLLKAQTHMSIIFYKLTPKEIVWLILMGFPVLFSFFWAVFSSPFNPSLYVRQAIFIIWTGLLHRLFYGLEILGSAYFTVVSFIALTSFLPFAFTGLKIEELFKRWKSEYNEKKQQHPPVVIETESKVA